MLLDTILIKIIWTCKRLASSSCSWSRYLPSYAVCLSNNCSNLGKASNKFWGFSIQKKSNPANFLNSTRQKKKILTGELKNLILIKILRQKKTIEVYTHTCTIVPCMVICLHNCVKPFGECKISIFSLYKYRTFKNVFKNPKSIYL